MLTNPNTLGLFDRNIEEIARDRPRRGRDALLRRREPERGHGHRPARATWASTSCTSTCTRRSPSRTAAAARAPARSRCRDRIEPFLPRAAGRAAASDNGPARLRARLRPAQVDRQAARLPGQLRRLRALVRLHPLAGRRRPARGLGDRGAERQLPEGAAGRGRRRRVPARSPSTALCMHEFVLSGAAAKDKLGVKTLDIAKRMLDHGVHPPTVYFPLLVDEALMIEPTETETKERLDHFADVVRAILEEAPRTRRSRADAPLHHAGAPPRRGRRRQAAGRPPAALGAQSATCASSAASSPRAASTSATTSARSASTSRPGPRRPGDLLHRRPARDHAWPTSRRSSASASRHHGDAAGRRARPRRAASSSASPTCASTPSSAGCSPRSPPTAT